MNRVFSSVQLDASGTVAGLRDSLQAAVGQGAKGLLLLIGSSNKIDLKQLPSLLRELAIPAVAVVVPGVLLQNQVYEDGIAVCGLTSTSAAAVVPDINRSEQELNQDIQQILSINPNPSGVLIVIDGLSRGVDNFVTTLHDCIGPDVQVIGAGCGHRDFSLQPNVITTGGLLSNAALLLFTTMELVTSVSHGWEPVEGPFLVTDASDNQIQQINYQPAFPFYLDILAQHLGRAVAVEEFAALANHYPFGMAQLDSEFLVRDPVNRVGNAIVFAGAVPTNAMVYLLHASPHDLVEAAGTAATDLRGRFSSRYGQESGLNVFLIDCISRRMVLGEDYDDELAIIRQSLPNNVSVLGILSIGEIANSHQGGIQWLNKTTVIGGLA
ncbi:MAG: FIST C-terminal domain-containing protein [Candidatus Thiodiazotropha sp. 'RUGA']|nr:FIST C-terminal domain-containing protein [Candidatus Thiodiazotropha sp. 'RUGA']